MAGEYKVDFLPNEKSVPLQLGVGKERSNIIAEGIKAILMEAIQPIGKVGFALALTPGEALARASIMCVTPAELLLSGWTLASFLQDLKREASTDSRAIDLSDVNSGASLVDALRQMANQKRNNPNV